MFSFTQQSIIYIVCPHGVNTGGPHAIYQLCHELIALGHDARIVFLEEKPTRESLCRGVAWTDLIVKTPVEPVFTSYRISQAAEVEDCSENLLIVPELAPDLLLHFQALQKAVWWLSTYSSPFSTICSSPDLRHLCQSSAALRMSAERKYDYVYPLSDYTALPAGAKVKCRQVAYNPLKGWEFTKDIQKCAPDISFIAIEKMTRNDVAAALARSMVYIDFGHHPGKDRIPREAAVADCCVIVARAGAAGNFEDVPIPSRYKVDIDRFNPDRAARLILNTLDGYDQAINDFSMYRRVVETERQTFRREVLAIFGRGAGSQTVSIAENALL